MLIKFATAKQNGYDMNWLTTGPDFARLTLHVQPGAKKTETAGLHGEALKIRLAAPPVDGKANACLLAFLAERCGVSRAAVRLRSGDSSRRKVVELAGHFEASDLTRRLLP